MKKIFLTAMALTLLVGILAACSSGEKELSKNTTTNPSVTENSGEPGNSSAGADNVVDTTMFIGEEKAKEIALERANLDGEGIVFERTELENDDGLWKYEIEFIYNNMEYDVEVKADTGEVLLFDTDSSSD